MFLVVLWFAMAIAIAVLAARYSRNGFLWLVAAILISPLIAGLLLLAAGPSGTRCPECRERIRRDARVCKHCGFRPGAAAIEVDLDIAEPPDRQSPRLPTITPRRG